ncbi:hypothetical protein JJB09_03505 [Rhizobium sp. KVB221]|uniref:Holin n=1 Tax=Rhizobium setariae TaxID=2801340 RepID=A0A936YRM7_9HYPH|nr:hypothetical protein [Rhizobium setariae]MBL0371085.1 hypothetical protein [Rhizobium setariae]
MDTTKYWYQSKTVWGSLIAIAAGVLQAGGIELGSESQTQLADILVALSGATGGLIAIYGRMTADRRLG